MTKSRVYLVARDKSGNFVGPVRSDGGVRTGFGGEVEDGESLQKALRREVLEESNGSFRFTGMEEDRRFETMKRRSGADVVIMPGRVERTRSLLTEEEQRMVGQKRVETTTGEVWEVQPGTRWEDVEHLYATGEDLTRAIGDEITKIANIRASIDNGSIIENRFGKHMVPPQRKPAARTRSAPPRGSQEIIQHGRRDRSRSPRG